EHRRETGDGRHDVTRGPPRFRDGPLRVVLEAASGDAAGRLWRCYYRSTLPCAAPLLGAAFPPRRAPLRRRALGGAALGRALPLRGAPLRGRPLGCRALCSGPLRGAALGGAPLGGAALRSRLLGTAWRHATPP